MVPEILIAILSRIVALGLFPEVHLGSILGNHLEIPPRIFYTDFSRIFHRYYSRNSYEDFCRNSMGFLQAISWVSNINSFSNPEISSVVNLKILLRVSSNMFICDLTRNSCRLGCRKKNRF